MTKDERIDNLKNKISMALKDPILQLGFEIICKKLSELEKENAELKGLSAVNASNSFNKEQLNETKELIEDMKADMCSTKSKSRVLCEYLTRILKKYEEINRVYFVYDTHVSSCTLSEALHTTTTTITVTE